MVMKAGFGGFGGLERLWRASAARFGDALSAPRPPPVSQLASAQSKVDQATATFDFTDNMDPIGYSARKIPLDNLRPRAGNFNLNPQTQEFTIGARGSKRNKNN
jgi:hypothetical protein